MKAELKKLAGYLPAPVQRVLSWTLAGMRRLRFALVRPYLLATRAWRRRKLVEIAASKQPVVLFLAPEAGLGPFYLSHAILARSLSEAGHGAILLSCNGMQPICSLKMAMRMMPTAPYDHSNAACRRCRESALRTGHDYGLVDLSLESLLGPAERAQIDEIIVANAVAPWLTSYDGISFGAAAFGEVLRDRRKLDVSEFTDADVQLLSALLYSALAIYFATRIIASRYSVKRIAHFGDYAYWVPTDVFAQRHGIAVTRLDHAYNLDVDHRYIGLRSGNANAHMLSQVEHWPEYRDQPIDAQAVTNIADSALYRLVGHGGVSTYSPNWIKSENSLLEELGLSRDRKTIVAYSSSTDELLCVQEYLAILGVPFAHGKKPFSDQVAWLRALIDWVGMRPDLQLIVRQHPRMAPSHRHSSVASLFAQMKREFTQTPANVVMIWPESKVSSYNLAELADVALVAWSNMSLELSRFGVPAVAAFPNIAPYPLGSFIGFGDNSDAYFRAVEKALGQPADMEMLTESFRWSHFLNWSPVVDASDLVPTFDYKDIPRWQTPKNLGTIVQVLAEGKDICDLNMARLPKGSAASAREQEAITAMVERFILFFVYGCDLREQSGGAVMTKLRIEPDGVVSLTVKGQQIRRYSPLARRLAVMLRQSYPAEMLAG
ncbi:MAG: hypothetical protein JWN71_2592 [Xanthobacteraceae bacterium]|jgi:hypothetical protein|nr:hypothetical protein [Xanthobacteraceae bacterium]